MRCERFSVACRKHRNCVLRRGRKEREEFNSGGHIISCSAAASTTTHHANDGHRERLAGVTTLSSGITPHYSLLMHLRASDC